MTILFTSHLNIADGRRLISVSPVTFLLFCRKIMLDHRINMFFSCYSFHSGLNVDIWPRFLRFTQLCTWWHLLKGRLLTFRLYLDSLKLRHMKFGDLSTRRHHLFIPDPAGAVYTF